MKPQAIYLLRHGESIGQVDKNAYKTTPDWKLPLTNKGIEQAKDAANKLKENIRDDMLKPPYIGRLNDLDCATRIYCSPWYRARQTAQAFRDIWLNHEYREDPRIREQEWGNYQNDESYKKIDEERDEFGRFFYRMPNGESGADVYDRVSTFLESMHRAFEKETYPPITLIYTHGNALRIWLMRFFHWSVEEYEDIKNPRNCEIIKMELNKDTNKYKLVTELRRGRKPN